MKSIKELAELQKTLAKIEKIRIAINKAIFELPDNPNIKRIGDKPNCFIVSSKDITSKWSPFYHDFKKQYKKITEVLDRARPENVIDHLNAIIATGQFKDSTTIHTFHPSVIDNLKGIIK